MGMGEDFLVLGGKKFSSRLLVGTGKYRNMGECASAIEESGAEIVTVAVRRAEIAGPQLEDFIDPKKYTFLPNSAGCYMAEEAVRTLKLAREMGGWNMVKLEIIGDRETLLPNMPETLKAAEILAREGFAVMAYSDDDLNMAGRLEDAGCAAVMPLAAPIGSGLGILRPEKLQKIIAQAKIPVLVDAGIGTASDACIAMEMGCAGVLLNTAIAEAKNPVLMARAMRQAVESGRAAHLAGRMKKSAMAAASSPIAGIMN